MIDSNLFVFDIETIPDLDTARTMLHLSDDISDEQVLASLSKYHDPDRKAIDVFFKPIFHKVVAISFAEIELSQNNDTEQLLLKDIRSGGKIDSTEEDLIKGFFNYIEKHVPRLISYNGRSFDLPVLKFRALKYGITTQIYNLGDKWNSYLQRYSANWHCDLHEILTDYYAAGKMKLDEVCATMGYPGKIDIDGSTVYNLYQNNKIQEIRDYCETDVLNTYLVYLNYALHYGQINKISFANAIAQVISFLEENNDQEHWQKFLHNWEKLEANKK